MPGQKDQNLLLLAGSIHVLDILFTAYVQECIYVVWLINLSWSDPNVWLYTYGGPASYSIQKDLYWVFHEAREQLGETQSHQNSSRAHWLGSPSPPASCSYKWSTYSGWPYGPGKPHPLNKSEG